MYRVKAMIFEGMGKEKQAKLYNDKYIDFKAISSNG
jgi:hypothetical protein